MASPVMDAFTKAFNVFHRNLVRVTGGRIGGKFKTMPVIELTTTGRKSGKPRTVMLTAPIHDDDSFVVVASYGGDDKHPAWYLNLMAGGPATARVGGGEPFEIDARTATPEEKAEMWPTVVAAFSGYAGYQKRTDRDIPLVVCARVREG